MSAFKHSFKNECPVGLKQTYLKVMGELSNCNAGEKEALNKIFGDVGDINQVFENGQQFVKPIINDPLNAGLDQAQIVKRVVENAKLQVGLD